MTRRGERRYRQGEGGYGGERRYEGGGGYGGEGGGYGRGRRYRRERRREERNVELVTFGLMLIVFALPRLFTNGLDESGNPLQVIQPSITLMLGGVLLLGGALYQSQRRWRVNPMTWLGGVAMLIIGVLEIQSRIQPFGELLPILIFGAVVVASALTGEF